MTPAEVQAAAARLVERTCREQGLLEEIIDTAVLRRVAGLLAEHGKGAPKGAPTGIASTSTSTTGGRRVHST